MTLAEVVAWVVFTLIIAWLGLIIYATLRQVDGEVREAAKRRR